MAVWYWLPRSSEGEVLTSVQCGSSIADPQPEEDPGPTHTPHSLLQPPFKPPHPTDARNTLYSNAEHKTTPLHGALLRTLLALQMGRWSASCSHSPPRARGRTPAQRTRPPTHTNHHITHCSATATIAQPPDCRLASGLLVTIRVKDELAWLGLGEG